MSLNGELVFLGTGGSLGVPLIGCACDVCMSKDPKNKRYRSSVLLTVDGKRLLIDCGPDYRTQALTYHIDAIDGMILTHTHNDHVAGVDEMRAYAFKRGSSIPCLLSEESAEDMRSRYHFLFNQNKMIPHLPPPMAMQVYTGDRGSLEFCGVKLKYFSYDQIGMRVDGFRFGDLAYVTDIHKYPESIFEDLKGVKTLIISALRFPASTMHFTVDQALDFIARVGAERAWLVHVSHELEHGRTDAYLPENVRMAYDGLKINFTPWNV